MTQIVERMRPRAQQEVLESWTDEDLLVEYRTSENRAAFEELVRRYERELFSYLRHYLGNAEMAEDAFQLTFLQVHLKVEQFELGRKVRPWLYTVATHQAIDAQRRNRRHRMASLDRRARGDAEEAGALGDMIASAEIDPSEMTQSREDDELVHQTVNDLPEQLRQVVVLVYYQGLKYREAADILDIPVGTVKSRLHVAIQKLQESLNQTHLPR